MTPIAWLIIAAIIIPVSYFAWALITVDRKAVAAIQTNLGSGYAQGTGALTNRPPLFLGVAKKLTPGSYEAKLDHWLSLAGRPMSMPLPKLITLKPALAGIGVAFAALLITASPSPLSVILGLSLAALLYFLPDLLIYNMGVKRQETIKLEFPNTLDQMLISVEAGLGFEAAVERASAQATGPLALELLRTLQDIQVGRPRQEAYEALAARSTVPEVRSFVLAVVQADKYGIGIANVLRAQAKQARVRRRQSAEERAMKLPVKVLFPLLLCIFPVLFIVLLGPAAIRIIQAFS
ncbi:type II secretion system F family protein [Paenarthrobacter ureafaciens]|uniref:type II secretion system F family protein n=1 Tax=Paenarthrobacter ureafaciens TaxID=37931 RepID=UPI0019177468|nr:type II secretion system F family protein [Paenarthrobacter ureafaciens]QQQ61463.1 type II secretion system F family protein [Paenarthrobacter ureafaciens]UOD80203.1 type II secretion system F family protein [Paenarthrobacter ureafaciens]WNZ04451.1 type II secretion system F family protein [Paenarthrobacter ureafaciens]